MVTEHVNETASFTERYSVDGDMVMVALIGSVSSSPELSGEVIAKSGSALRPRYRYTQGATMGKQTATGLEENTYHFAELSILSELAAGN